jgi:acetyl-CoA carboxylase biotin carboxyl carrier protein
MDLDQLKQILDLVREHGLSEFEIEQDGLKLRIARGAVAGGTVGGTLPASPAQTTPVPAGAVVAPSAASPALAGGLSEDTDVELAVVKSPIVGTFYRSPEPAAPSFVEIGSFVKKGQVLCIIEAMKLMNEIDSEYEGEVVNVYVENGQPVQYGERLFAIRTTS